MDAAFFLTQVPGGSMSEVSFDDLYDRADKCMSEQQKEEAVAAQAAHVARFSQDIASFLQLSKGNHDIRARCFSSSTVMPLERRAGKVPPKHPYEEADLCGKAIHHGKEQQGWTGAAGQEQQGCHGAAGQEQQGRSRLS
ncbi:hypothetical protein HaLaN_13683, partial [Haematococcus lacustris]